MILNVKTTSQRGTQIINIDESSIKYRHKGYVIEIKGMPEPDVLDNELQRFFPEQEERNDVINGMITAIQKAREAIDKQNRQRRRKGSGGRLPV